ncbi:hypothetical protein [Xenorhabdus bovienii]|uniref:Uncharacterized protein n=1 Tax=Xenorhabdus bovienii str. kraussei Becker Underwood TaxID=1398204 RepID=A0A077PUS9_XENBV|nr:hypothetical protein [Xenorhabdus bovienii]CDH24773.1 hypothetical protein; putative exported protein [Xenorhabdus bovienii str. kraussei Becker Underwood]
MKYLMGFVMILLSFTAFSKQDELDFKAWEKAGGWGIYNEKPDSHFKPLKINSYKEAYLPTFSYLIKRFNFQNVNNKYCLIGYKWNETKDRDERENIIVFWKTANYLINWNLPDGKDDDSYKTIIFSKPFIDMSESVVPYKEAEGAQALWAKEGVIQMMNDCELNGQKITITPSGVR